MNKDRLKPDNLNKGFTLLELIIVIAIMAVLVGFLIPWYLKFVEKSRVATDEQIAQAVHDAVAAAVADEYVTDRPLSGFSRMNLSSLNGLAYTDFVDEVKGFLQVDDLDEINGRLKSKTYQHDIQVELDTNLVTIVTLSSNKVPEVDHLEIR
ncbi:MAG: prepilin-type N-terminal cleavage/methylation domain-containing protein [Lachnospiraceae bacterium]|nr:prepilin-type N-terminal cleavage/methylation domain-containing protein [Lachnospiraceae bacterium]